MLKNNILCAPRFLEIMQLQSAFVLCDNRKVSYTVFFLFLFFLKKKKRALLMNELFLFNCVCGFFLSLVRKCA